MKFTAPSWVLVACFTSACAAPVTLVGFPNYDVEEASEEADRLTADVRKIEAAIDQTPSASADEADRRYALEAILKAQLSLSNEHFSFTEPPQVVLPGRPPIQLYPRLTSPAIVEPRAMSDGSPDGASTWKWFVPYIANKDAFYWDESFERVWLGREPEQREYHHPGVHFAGWLERHGYPLEERQPQALRGLAIQPGELAVPLTEDVTYTLPDVVPNREGFAFGIPVARPGSTGGVEPGFYDIRILPVLHVGEIGAPRLQPLVEQLGRGDWYAVLDTVTALRKPHTDPVGSASDWSTLAAAVEAYVPTYFDRELEDIRTALDGLATAKGDERHALLRLQEGIFDLVDSNHHPAPVLLDAPARDDEPFRFVVAADFQYGGDMTRVRQFLSMLDGSMIPHSEGEETRHPLVSQGIYEKLREARFVLAVGDLADGAGLSSSPGKILGTSLGLTPPLSPYDDEFRDLRRELMKFRYPIIGVPGNHDGFASYGGLLNDGLETLSNALKLPIPIASTILHPIGESLSRLARAMPTLIKIGRLRNVPFFDGLVEWQYNLGPLNVAFDYRGHSFVGLNSYALNVCYRDQVGALANNWGGGVERSDAVWFDVMLQWLRVSKPDGSAAKHQFAFMHHDPRAGRPFLNDLEEGEFGGYDSADAFGNTLTFGYFGIGWSSRNPLWIPVISPIANNLPQQLILGDAKFNQEWMAKSNFLDPDCYGARPLIEAIDDNLAGGPQAGGLSHIFFGHDDVATVSRWAHPERGGAVFPPPLLDEWPDSKWGWAMPFAPFFRMRTLAPPSWAREISLEDGRNAVVLRCDDVGQSGSLHGIYLITVDPGAEPGKDVVIEWIQIPS